jgi:acyl-coenzyme A thioesterase PaaI-like protein
MTKSTFFRWANSRWRMGVFMLMRLPAAWFMGLRVQHCDAGRTQVALPYRWRSQNPFKSTYFAAQCAAAEMSTGLMALAALQERPPFSMLVTEIRAEFYKKASETLIFECTAGTAIEAAITQADTTGEAVALVVESHGTLPDGALATRVWVTWSFKRKGTPDNRV